jgi:hypothetical protein
MHAVFIDHMSSITFGTARTGSFTILTHLPAMLRSTEVSRKMGLQVMAEVRQKNHQADIIQIHRLSRRAIALFFQFLIDSRYRLEFLVTI